MYVCVCVCVRCISSGFELNTEQFKEYKKPRLHYLFKNTGGSTCQPVFTKYWSMEPILFLVPFCLLGICGEEAQESRNEDRKYFRSHSRGISRASTKEDIFNLLLISSNPLNQKATKTYLPEAPRSKIIKKKPTSWAFLKLLAQKVNKFLINLIENKFFILLYGFF